MATASLGSLVVSLGLDAAEYLRGLTKAQRDAQIARDDIVRVFEQARGLLVTAGVAAAGAIGLITKASIDAADHLLDLNKATGITVETLGGIGFAASQAGGDLDGTAASLGKLNLQLAGAARGDKDAVAAFKALGISVKDLQGNTKATDVVLGELAERFGSYADWPEVAALANALFGKSYQSILPLLRDGGVALRENVELYRQFGGTTTETARQADQFNDTLGQLALVGGQFGRELTVQLLPSLQAVADEMLRLRKESTFFKTVAAGVRTVFETLAVLGANVAFVLDQVGQAMGAYLAISARLAVLDVSGAKTIGEAYRAQAVEARKELDALERRILSLPAAGQRLGARDDPRSLGIGSTTLPGVRAPRLPDAGAKDKRGIAADLSFRRAELSATAEVNEALRQTQLKATLEQQAFDAAVALKRFDDVHAAFRRSELEATETVNKALKESQAAKHFNELSEFAKQAQRNIQDAVGDTLLRGLQGSFRSIEDLWKSMLQNMLAQALATRINEALFGRPGINGAPSTAGLLTGLFAGFFAGGGFVPPGRWGIAGERGPEPVFGGRSGATVVAAGSGRAVRMGDIHIRVDGTADRERTTRQMAAIVRGAQDEQMKQLKAMGLLGAR